MLHSLLLFNIFLVLEVLARAIRQDEKIRGIQIGKKEVKLWIFVDDMILHRENPTDFTKKKKKNVRLINEFNKASGYKINIQKSVAFLYNSSKISEKNIKKTIPFTIA